MQRWYNTVCEPHLTNAQHSLDALAEIDELVQQKDVLQLCPYYLDIQGEQLRLQVRFLALAKVLISPDANSHCWPAAMGF